MWLCHLEGATQAPIVEEWSIQGKVVGVIRNLE
jgi:SOS-response transcriptional repressor LexA